MMEQFFGTLWRLFSHRTIVFSGDSAAATARTVQTQQIVLYTKLIDQLKQTELSDKDNGAPHPIEFSNGVTQVFVTAQRLVARYPAFEDAQPDGRVIVRGQFPILTENTLNDFFRFLTALNFTDRQAGMIGASVAAALIVELQTRQTQIVFDSIDSNEKLSIVTRVAEYIAAKAIIEYEPALIQRHEPEIAALRANLSNAAATFEKERADQRGAFDALAAAGMDLDEKQRSADEAIEAANQRLMNFEASVRAELQLDRARLNWGTRHKEARRSFLIASFLLTLVLPITLCAVWLAGPAIVEFVNRPSLINFLPGGSGVSAIGHQVARLAIVSFPIVVFLWLLRVLVRFFMRSMLLMDDARQRETMLDTYFLLSGQGRADEKDRPLILWALFRQTPGHGPDGIEPPDFTDVINAGFNRSKMPS